MDTQRLILMVVFSMSIMMLWDAWTKHNAPPKPSVTAQAGSKAAGAAPPAAGQVPGTAAPATAQGKANEIPSASAVAVPAAPVVPVATPAATGELITIDTDLYQAKVSTVGGVLTEFLLKEHRDAFDKTKPYELFKADSKHFHLAQTGLTDRNLPNHATLYTVEPGPRALEAGKDAVSLVLKATANGVTDTQTLTFKRGTYLIDVAHEVKNDSAAPVNTSVYYQLTRNKPDQSGISSMGATTYVGPALYTEAEKFKKVDFDEMDKLKKDDKRKVPFTPEASNGWVGMVEQYFVSAFIPADGVKREYFVRKPDDKLYSAGALIPLPSIAPGQSAKMSVPLYVGPQEQDKLAGAAKGLDLVVDYGIFHIIAAPIFWLLKFFHGLVKNWGWAIVLLTILIKGVFYPLNAAAGRSMGKMKLLGPKLKQLQEQYANDRMKLNQAMMELYKKEKINPLGGCLPILIQMPVFIALYWVLIAAVELRHAPWILWIKDLAQPDPWYVLPVIYAFTAWLQMKLQPPSPGMDPMQQKVFQWMPVMFAVMFIFFPAGLVLYWTVSNILQIAQQYHINKMLEKEQAAAATARR